VFFQDQVFLDKELDLPLIAFLAPVQNAIQLIIFDCHSNKYNIPLCNIYNLSTMIRQSAFFFVLLAASSAAIKLTPDNFYNETDGKTVFIKFFVPW
jgi:hypothetical protein